MTEGVNRKIISERRREKIARTMAEHLTGADYRRELHRTWYVMEMNKGKKHVPQDVKVKQKEQFEDAVIAYGKYLQRLRRSVKERRAKRDNKL